MGPLTPRLQRVLGPLPPSLVRAFEHVEARSFLPAHLAPLAGADAPLPFYIAPDGAAAVTPSPRALAALLLLLEVEEGSRVLVLGAESGYLAALLRGAGAKVVRLVEPDRATAEVAETFATQGGFDGIEVRAGPPAREAGQGTWDRILLLDPRRTLGPALTARLADLGFALGIAHTAEGLQVVRTVRAGEHVAEVRATDLALGGEGLPEGPGSFLPPAQRATLTGLLTLEGMAQRVWNEPASTLEQDLRRSVDATWHAPALEATFGAAERERRALARRVFHLGYLYQAAGDLADAADLYQRSVAVLPSAEGHTFLGWVRFFEGRLEDAMACCHRAIAVDPSLGNPYNDLGSYLLELGRPAEAVPWLQRALRAERYEATFFPHLNLARAALAQGDDAAARQHLQKVLELQPGHGPALELLRRLDGARR